MAINIKPQSQNITDLRLSRNNFGTPEDWQFVTVPQRHAGNRIQDQVQGRVLGFVEFLSFCNNIRLIMTLTSGGSAINSGMYLR